ncbi:MAG: endonuclease/exonuclease/phosphatase family protein [Firmicutes bacterium]|nr:endonuclease/exonuclease/phosphatase family protein [Bacillota bacterium]
MKIMSFNVRINVEVDKMNSWEYRKDEVAKFINKEHPDIIGLQEPNLEMLDYLMDKLTRYRMVGLPRSNNGEFTPILYDTLKLTLVFTETFWLSDSPNKESRFETSFYIRIATYGLFKTNEDKFISVVNTHLDYQSEEIQCMQMKVILDYLKQKTIYPQVIMGDFNAIPSASIHQLLHENEFKSIYLGEQLLCNTFHGFTGITKGEPIDYIYVSKHLKSIHSKILDQKNTENYLSDHFPVTVEITI